MRTIVVDVELTTPPQKAIEVGTRHAAWILLRVRGRAVGWLKYRCGEAGARLRIDDLIERATQEYGITIFELLASPEPRIDASRLPSMSVVICTRNHPEMLRRQLTSCAALKYEAAFEVIVVDNAPTDDRTRRVCDEFDAVRYICEPTPGLDFARNAGIRAARFDVAAYTDDDAVVDPNWLTSLGINYFDPDVHCVTGIGLPLELETDAQRYFEMYGGFQHGFRRFELEPKTAFNTYFPLGAGSYGAGVNLSVRRQVLLKLGGFDEALDTGSIAGGGGDLDIMARVLIEGGKLVYDPRAIVWHEHRRTMRELRKQMWNYGHGFYAYVAKYANHDLAVGNFAFRLAASWFWQGYVSRLHRSIGYRLRMRGTFPISLQLIQMAGSIVGWFAYKRSKERAERLVRRSQSIRMHARRVTSVSGIGRAA